MRKRTLAREIALQELYHIDLLEESPPSEEVWANMQRRSQDEAVLDFAKELLDGVLLNRRWIDQVLEQFLENWELSRLSVVDRQILRLGVYQLFFCPEIPAPVVLSESVELAKRFSTAKSGAFINGVLDAIWKRRKELEATKPS